MSFEPNFEKINYNGKINEQFQQIKVECKTDISSENVKKIIGISSKADITRKDKQENKIIFGGKTSFYVCYENIDGELCKFECGNEFAHDVVIDNLQDCSVSFIASTDKVEADVSGIKVVIICYVNVGIKIYPKCQINALCGGDNLIVDNLEVPISIGLGVHEGVYPVEEEFEFNYVIKEVLSHRANAVITSVQCGVGCIIIDGEVFLSAMLLQSDEKNSIIKENKTLPFRMELECDEAMPTLTATAYVKVKSFKTDIAVDQDKSISTVTASVILQFEGEAISTNSNNVSLDAFSLTDNLSLKCEQVETCTSGEVRSLTLLTTTRASTEQLEPTANLVGVFNDKAEIVSVKNCEEGCTVTGTLTLTALFIDQAGEYFSRFLEAPFEHTLDCGNNFDFCKVIPTSEKTTARIVSLSEIELESQLIFTIYPFKNQKVCFINEVNCDGDKPINDSAISVYIPIKGEGLWQLSKRLNVCPETLLQTNKDLEFPLSGKERIVIYRQK